MVGERSETFRCWRHGATGNALHLIGIEQDIIDCGDWIPGGLSTEIWSEIFEAACEAGYDLPDREFTPDDVEHVAVLPDSPTTQAVTNSWDWTNADDGGDSLSVDDARERTTDAITAVIERRGGVLVEALPTMGKTFGAVAAATESGVPVTIATGRGRKEMYPQYREYYDEYALEHYTLPAFTHGCPTANGDHGDEWQEGVMPWYRAGTAPQEIHKFAESELGRPLPCQEYGESPYSAKWRFESDDYDVLIGHYSHLHNEKATKGRGVLVDEFPGGAFETALGGKQLTRAASPFLERHPELPFDDYTDLIENRDDDGRRADALLWFEDHCIERDGLEAFADGGHAGAPIAVYTLLASDKLGNGWNTPRSATPSRVVSLCSTDAKTGCPSWIYRHSTTPATWSASTAHRRRKRGVLGLRLIRTTDSIKSYRAGEGEIANRVTVGKDSALYEASGEKHGQKPALVATACAEKLYNDEGVLEELIGRNEHHGDVLGSNKFDTCRLGVIGGSRNFDPDKKWGAYLDETVGPRFPDEDNGVLLEASVRTDYGDADNRIRKHMTEHDTLQAAMRFGRDGNGAIVYVHTNTLLDWVSTVGEGRILKTWSDGMQQVVDAASDLNEWTTAELADHSDVEITERQVRTHLWRLVDRDVVTAESESCGYVWKDDGLHRVNDHGDVELEPVGLDEMDGGENAEAARMNHYRWDFRALSTEPRSDGRVTATQANDGNDRPPTADGLPPNPGD